MFFDLKSKFRERISLPNKKEDFNRTEGTIKIFFTSSQSSKMTIHYYLLPQSTPLPYFISRILHRMKKQTICAINVTVHEIG